MRVAEDGVLTDWFRKPHTKFGTSYRIVNMVVILQLLTIVISRGEVFTLGEAYAFGVIWSFTFNSLAMLVLRWKYKGERGWKVPPNIYIGKREIPVGLISVFMVLLSTAIVNLFTKSVATVSGILFAATFFIIFSVSEKQNLKKHKITDRQMREHFQLEHEDTIGCEALQIQPGCVMVTMRDAINPIALKWALARTNTDEQDVVVLTARMVGAGGPEFLDTLGTGFQRTRTNALHQGCVAGRKLRQAYISSGCSGRRCIFGPGAKCKCTRSFDRGVGYFSQADDS